MPLHMIYFGKDGPPLLARVFIRAGWEVPSDGLVQAGYSNENEGQSVQTPKGLSAPFPATKCSCRIGSGFDGGNV